MPLPRVGDGRQLGDGNLNEPILVNQASPVSTTNSTTLTVDQISAGLILATPTVASTYTLPSGVLMDAGIAAAKPGTAVDFTIINQSVNSLCTVTLAAGTGFSLGAGSAVIAPGDSASFRARRMGRETWTVYRRSGNTGGPIGTGGADVVVDVTSGNAATLIQTALDAVKASGRRSTFIKIESSGAFNLTSGIVINPWYHVVDFAGAVVTYTPTTGPAISLECDQVNVFTQLVGGPQNINLVGGRAVGNTSIGLYCYGTAASTRTSCAMYNITIDGFSEGVTFDDYAYLTHFYGLVVNGFRDYGINQRAGAHDAGENISVHGGCISNGAGGAGTAILCSDDSSEIELYGVSLDYNTRVCRLINGRVYMSGGHIEFNGGTAVEDQFYIANQSHWAMDGVYWVVNTAAGAGPYSYSRLINVVDSNSVFSANQCRYSNHRNVDDLWAVGNGKVINDRPSYFNVSQMPFRIKANDNVLADGGFEQATVQDLWYVTSQGGTYTSRLQKSDGIICATSTDPPRTGTRCLKVTRGNVGAGYAQGLRIVIPVIGLAGKTMFCNFWAKSNLGANTVMSFYQCMLANQDANLIPTWARRTAYAAPFQSTNIPNDWTTEVGVQNGSSFRVESWVTHIEIEFDITAGAALTSLWLDDFVVNFY